MYSFRYFTELLLKDDSDIMEQSEHSKKKMFFFNWKAISNGIPSVYKHFKCILIFQLFGGNRGIIAIPVGLYSFLMDLLC